eukprot:4229915-Ditylum_brightwellii.AAC.1
MRDRLLPPINKLEKSVVAVSSLAVALPSVDKSYGRLEASKGTTKMFLHKGNSTMRKLLRYKGQAIAKAPKGSMQAAEETKASWLTSKSALCKNPDVKKGEEIACRSRDGTRNLAL